ncbi:ApaLI family restriction endonuclease [Deferribacterales bacterium RsTz2092]
MNNIYERILALSNEYSNELRQNMAIRLSDMKSDDNSHYLIYQVLGISTKEGQLIDEYQNKGRFLYKYAGSFLEEATILCFEYKYSMAQRKVKIKNTVGVRPAKFEIDCLVGKDAYEIKWRDATTDGDHITKEHTRIQAVKNAGYKPVRIMFFYPNRSQAQRIQEMLASTYKGVGGEYYFGDKAWEVIKSRTDVDLLAILKKIAKKG